MLSENKRRWSPVVGMEGVAEEIMIIHGRLYDAAFDKWLELGDYASRPPGELHGPFKTDGGCVVLEMSFPSQMVGNGIGR